MVDPQLFSKNKLLSLRQNRPEINRRCTYSPFCSHWVNMETSDPWFTSFSYNITDIRSCSHTIPLEPNPFGLFYSITCPLAMLIFLPLGLLSQRDVSLTGSPIHSSHIRDKFLCFLFSRSFLPLALRGQNEQCSCQKVPWMHVWPASSVKSKSLCNVYHTAGVRQADPFNT